MTPTKPTIDLAAEREQARRVRRALAMKERRELRPALWAGLAIFVGLPLLWSIILVLIDPEFTALPGVATATWLLGGWLYGAVIGAQTVCRDFGRSQGAFLVGLPVSRAQIVEAKVAANLRLLLLISAIIAAIEIVSLIFGMRLKGTVDPLDYAPLAAALPFCTWLLAFAAAATVRNTLTAVVLAITGLALIAALPLVSAGLAAFLWPWIFDFGNALQSHIWQSYWAFCQQAGIDTTDEQLGMAFARRIVCAAAVGVVAIVGIIGFIGNRFRNVPDRRRSGVWRVILLVLTFLLLYLQMPKSFPYPAMVILGVALLPFLSNIAARVALRSERGVRVSMRALVGGIATLVVSLFVLAMGEAGANGRVTDVIWEGANCRVVAGRQFAVRAQGLPWYHSYHSSRDVGFVPWRWGPARFLRGEWDTARVEQWTVAMGDDDAFFYLWVQFLEDPRIATEEGQYQERRNGTRWVGIVRVDLETGLASTPQRVPLPTNIDPCVVGNIRAAIQGDRLFLFCSEWQIEATEDQLCGYNSALAEYLLPDPDSPPILLWQSEGGIAVNYYFQQNYGATFVRGVDRFWYLQTWSNAPVNVHAPDFGRLSTYRFSLSEPDLIAGHTATMCPVRKDIVAMSSVWGLALIQEGVPGERIRDPMKVPARIIGRVSASPWAALFRAPSRLLPGRAGQLWELHDKSAICYDVSDPTQPRRILHVQTYPIRDAAAGDEYLLLEHDYGFSVVMHP